MTIAEADRTAGATPAPYEVPPGRWEREASHNPRPLTPMGSSIFVDGLNQSFPKVFAEFGLLVEALEYREIGGYVYNRTVPFGPANAGNGKLPPAPLLWLGIRVHPAFRRRLAVCKRALESKLDRKMIARWNEEWRPQLIDDIARLRAVDVGSLSDDALAQHMEDLLPWVFRAFDVHFYLSAGNGFPVAQLAFFCRDHLGYDDLRTFRLMSGLSSASSEPAIALARLADIVRADPELQQAVVDAPARDVPALLRPHDRAGKAFDAYVDEYGYRALRYEVVDPLLGEQPEILSRLLQDQLQHPADLATEQRQLAAERDDAKREGLSALPSDMLRAEFEDLVQAAAVAYPVREDNEFYTISVPLALCRTAALEAGKRLVAADQIALQEDVFFLRWEEAVRALRGEQEEWAEMIAGRQEAHAAAGRFQPPAAYGDPAPLPPVHVLPSYARQASEVFLYLTEKIFEAEQSHVFADADAKEIRGRAAARGTYRGPARVIMGEHEFDRLQSGEVLVCPITSPVWSILFAKVGALVTDFGGILSHPAIIAREYGIPAVVATGNGTSVIRDGQQVEVDGDTGVVRILE
jgi:pyruvate,water dikinase